MKKILCLFFIMPLSLFPEVLFQDNYALVRENQNKLAYTAKNNRDYITLIQLAKRAYSEKGNKLWERGLIDWAKEIILAQYSYIGAYHLAGYYSLVENRSQEFYWRDLALYWKKHR